VHLLAAFNPASGVVLGQSQVEGRFHEITAFAPLLDRIDLTWVPLTADALHTLSPASTGSTGSRVGSAQYGDLLAQHEQLDVLG
jgi:hypothetical protein